MWKLKDPNSRIIFTNGRPEMNASTVTDEAVESLLKANPNYAPQFEQVKEDKKIEAAPAKAEAAK